jgi:hypothetical protein
VVLHSKASPGIAGALRCEPIRRAGAPKSPNPFAKGGLQRTSFKTKQFIFPLWERGMEGDFAAHSLYDPS